MNPLDALLADEEKKKQVMKLYGLGMPLRQGAEAAPLTQPAPAPVTAPTPAVEATKPVEEAPNKVKELSDKSGVNPCLLYTSPSPRD